MDSAILAAESKAWCLLFQVDSDDNAGMAWGDFGMLHFYINEHHLQARDFSKVWLEHECT